MFDWLAVLARCIGVCYVTLSAIAFFTTLHYDITYALDI